MSVFEFLLALYSPRILRLCFWLVLLPGILTSRPAVHSFQATLLLLLMTTGVSYVSLAIH